MGVPDAAQDVYLLTGFPAYSRAPTRATTRVWDRYDLKLPAQAEIRKPKPDFGGKIPELDFVRAKPWSRRGCGVRAAYRAVVGRSLCVFYSVPGAYPNARAAGSSRDRTGEKCRS